MLQRRKKRIHIDLICLNIIILFTINVSIILINLFTNHSVVTKESIVGINPVVASKSIMTYNAPLTVVLENKKEKEIQLQPKVLDEIESNIEEHQEVEIDKEDKKLEQKKELFYETEKEEIALEPPVEMHQEETEKEIQSDRIQKQEMQNDLATQSQNFASIGKIEIPTTQLEIPIFNQVTLEGMKKAPCLLYSTGELNHSGNHLIVGHNFRNGTIFSNNKNLKLGDKIFITTLDRNKVEYTIYRKFITTAEDVSYIKRDTYDRPEITLSCCTDDDKDRIVILARVES